MEAKPDDLAIRVNGLRKDFGEIKALKGIDFEVPRATVFGLLGPNGAGKTTAIRILSTIVDRHPKPATDRHPKTGHLR